MTRTRLLAALVMAPLAIAAILLLPTPWLVALAAVLFLIGLWEWFDLAEIDDTLSRTVLLVANLALMVALVWASRSSVGYTLVLFQLVTVVGVVWWLVALLWLGRYDFACDHDTHARVFKLAAGALAMIPAWCALAWIHASQPNGHRWLLTSLVIVWAADSGAYFAGRKLGGVSSQAASWRRASAPTRPSKACSAVSWPASWLACCSPCSRVRTLRNCLRWRWSPCSQCCSRWSATCSRACSSATPA